jgi:hypothetical protein
VTGSLRSLLVGHRAPGLGNALDLLGKLQIHVPVEEDVNLVLQIARANVLVAQIDVGDFALIE